jgi:hypothetical protein
MANNFNQADEAVTVTGLGTFPFIVPTTKFYNVNGTITLPTISSGNGASSVVVTMNLNGASAFYTGTAGAEGFASGVSATAGDTINVILTSAAVVDNQLNAIKSTITVN